MAAHEYHALIHWARGGALFTDNRYSRGHTWRFDGGIEVPASSSPSVVRTPLSVEAAVDPEEAFVAALASCHMLWFLDLARRDGLVVDDYRDDASGVLGRDGAGRMAMLRVTLHPQVRLAAGAAPERLAALHERAHQECFIANSVRTEVLIEPGADA
jgi:organic hydroperoxide reductase OsmC/OhrA